MPYHLWSSNLLQNQFHQTILCIGLEINICTQVHNQQWAFKTTLMPMHVRFSIIIAKNKVFFCNWSNRTYLYIEVDDSYWRKPEGYGRTKYCIPVTSMDAIIQSLDEWIAQKEKIEREEKIYFALSKFPKGLRWVHRRSVCNC